MISNLDDFLSGIVIGVRFRANFSIEDELGKITDTILYPVNSSFNPSIFPEVISTGPGQKVLINHDTQDSLSIDNSNIILTIQLTEGSTFHISDVDQIPFDFNKQIIKGIMKEFSIKEIIRIGFIRRYLFPIEELANSFVEKTIGNTLQGINDINLRFSKRIPVFGAIAIKDTNDYDNAIFNIIKRADRKEIFMSIDHQKYYDPFLPDVINIDYDEFLNITNKFSNSVYLPWLNRNYAEIENE
jgi:hypothetical protein